MNKITIPIFATLLIITFYLQSEIDVQKEVTEITEEMGEEWLNDECDATISTMMATTIHVAFLEKYRREMIAQRSFAFCGDATMANTFTPSDEVVIDFVFDALIDINGAVPKDVADCRSNRYVEQRVKELIFEPNTLKGFIYSTFNHLRLLTFTTATIGWVDVPVEEKEKIKACKSLYKDPEYTMPPSWLD